MQTLTPALTAILKDTFQAAASGFRGRFEVDLVTIAPPTENPCVALSAYDVTPSGTYPPLNSFTTRSDAVVYYLTSGGAYPLVPTPGFVGSFHFSLLGFGGAPDFAGNCASNTIRVMFVGSGTVTLHTAPATNGTRPIKVEHHYVDAFATEQVAGTQYGTSGDDFTFTFDASVTDCVNFLDISDDVGTVCGSGWGFAGADWVSAFDDAESEVVYEVETLTLRPKSISVDKSLRLATDSATVEFANEDLPLGWGPDSIFVTNSRCRIFQWYGDEANAVQTFEGLIDTVRDHRDVLTTSLVCRDMMAILIDQTFGATAPQGAAEEGAVRTTDNGVYLSMEVSDIVSDILDRAGWPTADREITETSYVLDEFIISDGASWAETIIGESQLTGLVGYSAWADEMGVFHFAPTLVSQNLTDPDTPAYTFRSGEDIVSLDDQTDQYDLRTRVKVRGPLTTTTLEDTWRELWRTSKITQPVGIWYAPSEPTIIRVISRSTKRLYRLRQSDRVVLGSSYLGGVIPHPLGLSGDPSDATIYWVLDAPWIYTGSTSGNSVKKVRKSDNHVLASYSLPSGRWSALKVSAAFMWLTNLDTDRFYKRDKSDASAIANYSHTYGSTVQANPSGMMVDGTTLYLFWANGGTTARFLVCDESAPGTITKVVKTAGTSLHGGEMDTTTHTECWGDSDSLNLVAKFSLLAAVDQTNEVATEVVDIDLEDELGLIAQLEDRIHDAHTGDAAHPYEVRRLTLDLTVITNIAQATQTAQRQLDIASQRRRVLDAGIVGNPGLQKTDYVAVVDPITGISTGFAVDTYRTDMQADGTYLGTVALLPVEDVTDDPADDGDAS